MGSARASDSIVSMAFNVGMPQPGPHRVLSSSVEAAEPLEDEQVGVVRIAGEEVEVPRFAALPPTHEATGHVDAMPLTRAVWAIVLTFPPIGGKSQDGE